MRKELRAISPIVSVILLILIAVAASVLIYTWMSGIATQNPAQQAALRERVRIESVYYNGDSAKIYIRNIGEVTANITSAYILNVTGTVAGENCTNTSVNLVLKPGETGIAIVGNSTSSCSLSPGTYIAKIVTKDGVEAVLTFTVS